MASAGQAASSRTAAAPRVSDDGRPSPNRCSAPRTLNAAVAEQLGPLAVSIWHRDREQAWRCHARLEVTIDEAGWLKQGDGVVFGGDQKGRVSRADVELDEYTVLGEDGEPIRDSRGAVQRFRADDLSLASTVALAYLG